jgi:hypothetical protein
LVAVGAAAGAVVAAGAGAVVGTGAFVAVGGTGVGGTGVAVGVAPHAARVTDPVAIAASAKNDRLDSFLVLDIDEPPWFILY